MTTPDLDGYVDVIGYELRELSNLTEWILSPRWPFTTNADQMLRNAMLEAHLLHARCLIEFLLNKDSAYKGTPQSIVARDLLPSWTPTDTITLADEHKQICDSLSHLSIKRVRAVNRDWDVRAMLDLIVRELEALTAQLGNAAHEVSLSATVANARAAHARALAPLADPKSAFGSTASPAAGVVVVVGSTGPPTHTRSTN